MNLDTSKWSQADYQTGIALLCGEAGRLEAALAKRFERSSDLSNIPARPAIKGGCSNVIADFALMASHVAKLNQFSALNAETAPNLSPNRSVPSTAGAITAGKSATTWDPDAAVLAARGVKTHAELSALQLPAPDFDALVATAENLIPAHFASANSTGAKAQATLPSEADGIGSPGLVAGWEPDKKILEARGVSSYEELNAKYFEGRRID